jgi:hypothetical protein
MERLLTLVGVSFFKTNAMFLLSRGYNLVDFDDG